MSSSITQFDPAFQWAVNQTLAQCSATVGSGYRTIDEQRALLYKRQQGILVADPGTSRHEGNHYGAVDMEGDLDCFARIGAQYGLTNEDVPGEPWHFQFTAEAEQAVADGTYADMFGMADEGQQPEDSLEGIRSIIYGQGGPENPVDVPERVEQAYGPKAQPTAVPKTQEGFTPEASAGFTSDGSAMSAVDVAKVYAQAGFTGDALVTMVAIAKGESGWNPGAQGDLSIQGGGWGPSMGLSQIRSRPSDVGGWRDPRLLSDPVFNAKAAFAISNGGTNFSPWTVYSKGIYSQYVAEAKAAVVALGSGAMGGLGPPAASVSPEDDEFGVDASDDLLDPVGISADIAQALLQAKGGTSPQDRITDEAAENKLLAEEPEKKDRIGVTNG